MAKKFKDRYVLGEGYPWVDGLGNVEFPYMKLSVKKENHGSESLVLMFPKELWDEHLPKYRIVLEKVKGKSNG